MHGRPIELDGPIDEAIDMLVVQPRWRKQQGLGQTARILDTYWPVEGINVPFPKGRPRLFLFRCCTVRRRPRVFRFRGRLSVPP